MKNYEFQEAIAVGMSVRIDSENRYHVFAGKLMVFKDKDIERIRSFLIGVAFGKADHDLSSPGE